MARRMLGTLAVPVVAGLALWAVPPATAAPITCPGGQTATKVAPGEWECVNKGGNTSNAENPKNPNAGKDKF